MPFDGADYRPAGREPRRRPTISDTAVTYGIAIFAAVLLLMPISVGALVDIVRYLHAR